MSLFQWGNFKLHSGEESWWRIDCDALIDSEIELFAKLIRERCGSFHRVVSPTSHYGSSVNKLTKALEKYAIGDSSEVYTGQYPTFLIVDDVLTTGSSMEKVRSEILSDPRGKKSEVWGAVLFARGPCPDWVTPVFQMPS